MLENIDKQLDIIEKSIHWINGSLKGGREKKPYEKLVNARRSLRKKKFSLMENPAAALYGESQVGKSYLVNSLLSQNGKPFLINGNDGVEYSFIEKINPPGGGSESTSLVTRFSVNYQPKNPNYPIKAALMSPADLVLVLCDSFYNDLLHGNNQNTHLLSVEEINAELLILKSRYVSNGHCQGYFIEDDVLDIQDYFKSHFQKADRILDSDFFHLIPRLIEKIDSSDWQYVFSLLWNKNPDFTELFSRLIHEYQKLEFASEIHLPINAVLCSQGTLLDVKRLRELFGEGEHQIEPGYLSTTSVLFGASNSELVVSKSSLCAIIAELVFGLPSDLIETKEFLGALDLLDFPGARSRMQKPLDSVDRESMPDLILRGKVSYLFNKYSESDRIQLLLFCAKHEQTAQRVIPNLLNNWIRKAIGKSPEKREEFINKSKISPFFVIGTFFNVQLAYNPLQDKSDGSGTPLENRWLQRFVSTLSNEYFEVSSHSWFNDWTISEPNFRNIYLLRDFEKSETPSNIFRGYNIHKEEIEEVEIPQYPNFRADLRQSFLNFDFVRNHFYDPEKAWDESATLNKDGTALIIGKLNIASSNLPKAREGRIVEELIGEAELVNKVLKEFYHNQDSEKDLEKAKQIAGQIQFNLATSFASDKIKNFGRLMKELMVDETDVLNLFRKKLDAIDYRSAVIKDNYSIFRIEVPVVEGDTAESYFERLCVRYEKSTVELRSGFKLELEERGINLDDLIKGNTDLVKSSVLQLSEALLSFWSENITLNDKSIIQEVFGKDGSLESIREMYEKVFKKLDLKELIAAKMRAHLNENSKIDVAYDIIANLSAELLNKCISSVGLDYFDVHEKNALKEANEINNLGLILENEDPLTDDTLEQMFSRVENWEELIRQRPEDMKVLPNFRNYLSWSNRLKVGFISVCNIQSYDVQANAHLGIIINEQQGLLEKL